MPAPNRILMIRLSSIGDIILTSPLIRLLSQQFPAAELDFVIKKRFWDLVRTNPHLNTIYTLDEAAGLRDLARIRSEIRQRHYDIVLDLHKNFRSMYLTSAVKCFQVHKFKKYAFKRFLLVHTKLNLYHEIIPVYRRYIDTAADLDIRDDRKGLEFHLDPKELDQINEKLAAANFNTAHPVLAIAPGAGYFTKRWLPERFAELAKELQDALAANIIILGGSGDQAIASEISRQVPGPILNLAGTLSLMQTACALASCDLLICNDTGLMHLAAALGTKLVAIFGATVAEFGFFPVATHYQVVQQSLACRPCSTMGSHRCPRGHFRCMMDIRTEDVLPAVMNLITGASERS